MPRTARKKSESGIYHIMLRGTNRQEIFHDDEDNIKFLEILDRYKEKSGLRVYGWCLMVNHVHLLLGEGHEDISVTVKRIGVSFAWFYNHKYKATGHLFQDRYRSEGIEKEKYLMAAVRYIHHNPVKAGIAKSCIQWIWSSCHGYYGKEYYPPALLDSEFILDMLSTDRAAAAEMFREYNETEGEEKFMDDTQALRLTDEEARAEIIKLIPEYTIPQIKSLPKVQRDKALKSIKRVPGLSQRQAARILGISPNLVFRA